MDEQGPANMEKLIDRDSSVVVTGRKVGSKVFTNCLLSSSLFLSLISELLFKMRLF